MALRDQRGTDMDKKITKTYSNGELTVVWKPDLCTHSAIGFHGLPAVFDPRRRPWVDVQAAPTDKIAAQVRQCPSGALSLAPAADSSPARS